MWQSFGYFDVATNAAILRTITERLRPHGRLVLDIYHRGFFEAHQGEQTMQREGRTITEHKAVTQGRLLVTLDYGDGISQDRFDWQLYSPDEIRDVAERAGLRLFLACTGFDAAQPPTDRMPRMQMLFEKA